VTALVLAVVTALVVRQARHRRRRAELRRRLVPGAGGTRGARGPDVATAPVRPVTPVTPVTLVASAASGWRSLAAATGAPLRRLARRPADAGADAALGGAVVPAVVALVLGSGVPLAAALGFAAWAGPVSIGLARRTRTRRARADEAPEVIDLIRLGVGAGLNVRLALEAVVRHHDGILATELRGVLARVGRGERLADALDSMGGASDALRPLVDALVASERDGAPLGTTLDRVATDARTARRRRREEAARRVPVKLLFPLVFCTLPAFALLTVVPVLLRSLPSLAP